MFAILKYHDIIILLKILTCTVTNFKTCQWEQMADYFTNAVEDWNAV